MTLWNEKEATSIKLRIQTGGRRDLRNVSELPNINTDVEMMLTVKKSIDWLTMKIQELETENNIKTEKLNILHHSKRTYTSTDLAKELGITSAKRFNEILVENKIFFRDKKGDLQPSYKYSDKGYFEKKQEILSGGKEVYYIRFTQKGREWVLENSI